MFVIGVQEHAHTHEGLCVTYTCGHIHDHADVCTCVCTCMSMHFLVCYECASTHIQTHLSDNFCVMHIQGHVCGCVRVCVCVCVDRSPLISELLYFIVDKEFHFLFSDSLYSPQITSDAFAMGRDRLTKKVFH